MIKIKSRFSKYEKEVNKKDALKWAKNKISTMTGRLSDKGSMCQINKYLVGIKFNLTDLK